MLLGDVCFLSFKFSIKVRNFARFWTFIITTISMYKTLEKVEQTNDDES